MRCNILIFPSEKAYLRALKIKRIAKKRRPMLSFVFRRSHIISFKVGKLPNFMLDRTRFSGFRTKIQGMG